MAGRRSKNTRFVAVAVVALAAVCPKSTSAQDISLFTALGNFVSGFDGSVHAAPVGFIDSDVFNDGEGLLELGVFAVNKNAGLLIGMDVLTGFGSKVPGLDLTGSVLTLPNIMALHAEPLYFGDSVDSPPMWANFGVGVGLSQLLNVKAQIPVSAEARVADVKGSGIHVGATIGISVYLGRGVGAFIDASLRHTVIPSIAWTVGGTEVVPPVGWPTSTRFNSATLRIGVGIAGGGD